MNFAVCMYTSVTLGSVDFRSTSGTTENRLDSAHENKGEDS